MGTRPVWFQQNFKQFSKLIPTSLGTYLKFCPKQTDLAPADRSGPHQPGLAPEFHVPGWQFPIPEANILDSSPDRSRGMNSTFLEIWEAIVPISSKISNLFKFWAQVKGIQVYFSIYSIKKTKIHKMFYCFLNRSKGILEAASFVCFYWQSEDTIQLGKMSHVSYMSKYDTWDIKCVGRVVNVQ